MHQKYFMDKEYFENKLKQSEFLFCFLYIYYFMHYEIVR